MADIPDYSGEEEEQDPNAVERLKRLVVEMAALDIEREDLEEQLKLTNKRLRNYKENLIPELMGELGMADLTTDSGIKVEMREEVRASFPKDPSKQRSAFDWLKSTGNDGLVKREFRIRYGRDATEWADAFAQKLIELGVENNASVEQTQSIHHQTLLAYIRRELKAGSNIPLESFGAFVQKFARIKRG